MAEVEVKKGLHNKGLLSPGPGVAKMNSKIGVDSAKLTKGREKWVKPQQKNVTGEKRGK